MDYDDDADDEESVNAELWDEGYNQEPYSDKPEEDQWDEDHPNGTYSYDEAKRDDELYETNTIEEWREYRDEKSDSDEPDSFPDINEWRDERNNNDEDE
jgi:hypothetical protein